MDNLDDRSKERPTEHSRAVAASRRFVTAPLAITALLFAYLVWPTPYAHYYQNDQNLRENRFTGSVETLTPSGWMSDTATTATVKASPAQEYEMPVPAEQLSHVQVLGTENGGYGDEVANVTIKLYNWSTKPIVGTILFDVTLLKGGKVAHQHTYLKSVYLQPQETSQCQIDTGFPQKEFKEFEATVRLQANKEPGEIP